MLALCACLLQHMPTAAVPAAGAIAAASPVAAGRASWLPALPTALTGGWGERVFGGPAAGPTAAEAFAEDEDEVEDEVGGVADDASGERTDGGEGAGAESPAVEVVIVLGKDRVAALSWDPDRLDADGMPAYVRRFLENPDRRFLQANATEEAEEEEEEEATDEFGAFESPGATGRFYMVFGGLVALTILICWLKNHCGGGGGDDKAASSDSKEP